MSIKIYLDTSDTSVNKSSNSSPGDANFIFGEILPNNVTNVSVYLESASIPLTVPSFYTGRNTSLVFQENGVAADFTATIPQGTYNGTELASVLTTSMNAAGGANTYTCTYTSTTKKMTIGTILPFTFKITSSSTCLDNIGFAAMTSFVSAKIGDYAVDLLGTRYIDMTVNFNATSVALNKRPNILSRIHLNDSPGNVVFYQANNPIRTVCNAQSLRSIEVRLYDNNGNLYAIDANHSCTYTLVCDPLD